jgi:CO/xanthine dehydrogenase FAD-binding subunit
MRSNVPLYELVQAHDLPSAFALLAQGYRPIAGGTDVMVLFEAGKLAHKKWMNIRGLTELKGFEVTPDHVTLGALTTYTDVRHTPILHTEFPMLAEAARLTGGIATQNRGTLGGNIVNASPAADSPPALLAYDAQVELTSERGARWMGYSQFHKGYKQMALAADELLTRIRLPRRFTGWRHYYRKVGTRRAQAISKVCFAGVRLGNDVRIALGSVASVPLLLQGDLTTGISPISDLRSTASYRLRVAQNLFDEFMRES